MPAEEVINNSVWMIEESFVKIAAGQVMMLGVRCEAHDLVTVLEDH